MAALKIALLLCVQVIAVSSLSCRYSVYDIDTKFDLTKYRYCNTLYEYCCNGNCCQDLYYYDISSWGIAGIVIGSLIGLGLLVSVIVAIICCCRSQPGHTGRALNTGTAPGVTIVQSGNPTYPIQQNVQMIPQPVYSGNAATVPAAYPAQSPPPYSQQDNAYQNKGFTP